jgi:hypothetical protein
MPILLAPLVPIALRIGALTAAGYGLKRLIASRTHQGRTDQRVEDAFDDLDEGLALHRPSDRADDRQTNTAARIVRVIRIGGQRIEVDAAVLGRFRIRRRPDKIAP